MPKHARRLEVFDEAIVSLYAKGLTTGEIQAHVAEIYDARVSRDLVSWVTDKVAEELAAWQTRQLDRRTAGESWSPRRRWAVSHALADLAFPGLTGCFTTALEAKTLRMLLATTAEQLVQHARCHQAAHDPPKAAQVITAAARRWACPTPNAPPRLSS